MNKKELIELAEQLAHGIDFLPEVEPQTDLTERLKVSVSKDGDIIISDKSDPENYYDVTDGLAEPLWIDLVSTRERCAKMGDCEQSRILMESKMIEIKHKAYAYAERIINTVEYWAADK